MKSEISSFLFGLASPHAGCPGLRTIYQSLRKHRILGALFGQEKVIFPSGLFYIETKIKIVLPDTNNVGSYIHVLGQLTDQINKVIMAVNESLSFRKKGCP